MFASPSAYMYAPKQAKDGIISQLGAEYDPKTDVWYVDCNRMNTMPDMVFTMQGFEYRVAAKYYARRVSEIKRF